MRAGSDILVNLHYQTNGKPAVNRMKSGSRWPQDAWKKLVQLVPNGATGDFAIPPNEPNYRAPVVQVEVRKNAELALDVTAHAPPRRDQTSTLTYPDGHEEVALRVPRYRYNWQILYQTRVPVPAGTNPHSSLTTTIRRRTGTIRIRTCGCVQEIRRGRDDGPFTWLSSIRTSTIKT